MNTSYVLGFIHPQLIKIIYLHNTADVDDICYSTQPKLLGCTDITKAKKYKSIDAAKNDIYKLRYHYRQFLNIKSVIVATDTQTSEKEELSDVTTYYIDEFESEIP